MVISRLGWVFFRFRSFTPVPLYIYLLITGTYDAILFIVGSLLIAIGESIRFISVGYIGKESRVTDITAPILMMSGPYAYVRNPIYTGNVLIYLGFTALSNCFLELLLPLVLIFFGFVYYSIVIYEESFLKQKFATVYEEYSQVTPRFVPRRMFHLAKSNQLLSHFSAVSALKSEQPTFVALAVCYILFVLKFLLF